MTEDKSGEDRTARLRRLAEERGRKSAGKTARPMAEQDYRVLVHELQVHQIELEIQNEELRMAQGQITESLAKYSDLYDFAPVGYITSNREGLILEANLTFAGHLGIERGRLLETPLWLYVATPDRARLRSHLEQVFKADERRSCELRLQRASGPELYVQLDSIRVLNVDGGELCRSSVTDISIRKEADEEINRVHDELERRVEERTAQLSESEGKYRKLSQEFQTLLNAISDTLILVSPEMEVLWTNRGNALELHETASDPIGQYCYKLLHDRSAPSEDCLITRCFDSLRKERCSREPQWGSTGHKGISDQRG